jgi:hypothetical protein
MQTSVNVSRPPLDAARTSKNQPGENSHLRPGIVAATSPTASEVIVTSKNECVSFPELVQSVRSLQPAQSPEVHALYAAFFLDPSADVTVKNNSMVVL